MRQLVKRLLKSCSRRRRVGEDTKRLPSLVKAMKTLVPRSVMKEVVASSSDRRQWGVLAAAWVGVSEREFIHAAAQELRMPYQDHVAAPDLTSFAEGARAMLHALRKVGAMVVVQGSEVVGFVATDPAEIRGLDFYDGTHNISMAPWTEIAKALDMAERIIAEVEANTDRSEALRRKEVAERVIELLISEAVHYGAMSVEIVASEGMHRYQFTASDGKMAVGTIQREALHTMMLHLTKLDGETFSHQRVGKVLVRLLGGQANVRLSWGARQHTAALEWRPERDDSQNQVQSVRGAETEAALGLARSVQSDSAAEESTSIPVLVVDDNPMFRRVLERLLKRENFEVSCAENGQEALERLATLVTFMPRVIICDLHMPKLNGKEFVARLKEEPRLRGIPVIMLTSDDGVDAELSMLELGADALISKSKDPRVLCAQVLRLSKLITLREAA
jgi:CheY-like chemotaxis protein